MSCQKFLITGTDTGIGKTHVTAALARALIEQGKTVRARKPVETGCRKVGDKLVAEDAKLLAAATGSIESDEAITSYRYCSPVAPLVAARAEGRPIDMDVIKKDLEKAAAESDLLLVEGAGGLLVPIAERYSFADLAKALDLNVIVVFGSRLGAINIAALTFEVLRSRAVAVAGYVFNEPLAPDLAVDTPTNAAATNRSLLKEIAATYEVDELGYFPYGSSDGNALAISISNAITETER